MINFKKWLQQEVTLGSDGDRDNTPTQTAQSTVRVAQNYLANNNSVDLQNQIVAPANKATLRKTLINAGNQAVKNGISGDASQTNAPAVASFIGKQFGAKDIINSPSIK